MTTLMLQVPAGGPPARREDEGRGLVEGLSSPHPLVERLPAVLQGDEFCSRLVDALDEALAPAISSLDCFDSYLDPLLAPEDFVDWMAGWVGLEVDENWPEERRRQLVQEAVLLYRRRGTVEGLARHVELYTGEQPEIEENGGCRWSPTAGSAFPGEPRPRLVVRVGASDETRVRVVRGIIASSRPAHMPFVVEERARRSRAQHAQPPVESVPDGEQAEEPEQ